MGANAEHPTTGIMAVLRVIALDLTGVRVSES